MAGLWQYLHIPWDFLWVLCHIRFIEFQFRQQDQFDDTESTLARGELFSTNDNLDSTPGIALPIFASAKVAQIIWSVPVPLVSFLYHAAAAWKVF